MSKREKSKKTQPTQPLVNTTKIKCQFPPCQVVMKILTHNLKPDTLVLCPRHKEFLDFLLWILPHIKIRQPVQQQAANKLILPSGMQFKPKGGLPDGTKVLDLLHGSTNG